MGEPGVSPAGTLAAPRRGGDHRPPRWRRPARRGCAARPLRHRRLHRPRRRGLRLRRPAPRRRHEHAPSAGQSDRRPLPARPSLAQGSRRHGVPAARIRGRSGGVQRRGDGARCHRVHGALSAMRTVPSRRLVRVAGGRPTGHRRRPPTPGDVRGLGPPGPRRGAPPAAEPVAARGAVGLRAPRLAGSRAARPCDRLARRGRSRGGRRGIALPPR